MTKAEHEREIARVKNAYRIFAESEDGRIVLEDMKKAYCYNSSAFVPGDSHASAHREGMRQVVVDILDLLEELKQKKSE